MGSINAKLSCSGSIFHSLDTPQEVLSFSSACKATRDIYNYNYRLGMNLLCRNGVYFKLGLKGRPESGQTPAWRKRYRLPRILSKAQELLDLRRPGMEGESIDFSNRIRLELRREEPGAQTYFFNVRFLGRLNWAQERGGGAGITLPWLGTAGAVDSLNCKTERYMLYKLHHWHMKKLIYNRFTTQKAESSAIHSATFFGMGTRSS